jgi:putative tricarboxylic transport membrane protein
MKRTDFLMGVVWLIVGMAIAWKSCHLGVGSFKHPGLGMTPLIIGLLLMLFSVCILVISHDVKGALRDMRSILSGLRVRTICLILLYLIGYGFFLEKTGYLITTFIFFLFLFKTVGSMKLKKSVVISLFSVLASYTLFVILLKVPLPSGIWRIG